MTLDSHKLSKKEVQSNLISPDLMLKSRFPIWNGSSGLLIIIFTVSLARFSQRILVLEIRLSQELIISTHMTVFSSRSAAFLISFAEKRTSFVVSPFTVILNCGACIFKFIFWPLYYGYLCCSRNQNCLLLYGRRQTQEYLIVVLQNQILSEDTIFSGLKLHLDFLPPTAKR